MRYDIIGSVQVCRGLPSFSEAIRDWFGGIIAATSAPGLGSPFSRLRRDLGTPPLPCMHATDWVQNRTGSPCRPNRTYPPTSPPSPFSLPPTYRRAFLPSFISSHANAGGTLAHRHTAPNPSPPPSTPCGVCSSAAIARHTPTASPTRGRSPGSRRAYRSYRTRPKPRSPLDRPAPCASPRLGSLPMRWACSGSGLGGALSAAPSGAAELIKEINMASTVVDIGRARAGAGGGAVYAARRASAKADDAPTSMAQLFDLRTEANALQRQVAAARAKRDRTDRARCSAPRAGCRRWSGRFGRGVRFRSLGVCLGARWRASSALARCVLSGACSGTCASVVAGCCVFPSLPRKLSLVGPSSFAGACASVSAARVEALARCCRGLSALRALGVLGVLGVLGAAGTKVLRTFGYSRRGA
jgi:hypothetical protein